MHRLITALLTGAIVLLLIVSWSTASRYQDPPVVPAPQYDGPLHAFSAQLYLNNKLAHAELLWRKSVEDRKEMVAAAGLDREFPDGYIVPYNIWDFARPSFFCPHDLERVGALGDGGKVVCGMSRYEAAFPSSSSRSNPSQELIMYSFGVNDDSSFEAAFLKRTNAQIWGYDYTVNSWAKDIPKNLLSRAHFKKAGIGKAVNKNRQPPFFTIQELMRLNGHDYVDIVKMDIEGGEYDAISSLVASVVSEHGDSGNATLPFGQLLVEIHLIEGGAAFTTPKSLSSFMEWWSAMEKLGLRPVNNEDNWIGDASVGKPRFMEYTLINVLDKRNKLLWV